MQAVKEKLSDISAMRKAKADAKAEEKVELYNHPTHHLPILSCIGLRRGENIVLTRVRFLNQPHNIRFISLKLCRRRRRRPKQE